jgi:uncharacterized membrane protein YdjX (TVP38/TMEM64 family)
MAGEGAGRWSRLAALAAVLIGAGLIASIEPEGFTRAAAALRRGGPGAAGLLAAAYVLGAVLLVPAPLVNLAAGFALGPLAGVALGIPAAAAGACTAFALGRWLVRARMDRLAARSPALAGLDAALATTGLRVVLLLRLAPLAPFTVLNYLLGATPVRLRDFALGTVLGSAPGLMVQVYLGSLAGTTEAVLREARRGTGAGAALLAAAASGVIVLLLTWLLRRAVARAAGNLPRR